LAFTLREENKLKVYENRMLRGIFGAQENRIKEDETGHVAHE
jgi:hypothetical protein